MHPVEFTSLIRNTESEWTWLWLAYQPATSRASILSVNSGKVNEGLVAKSLSGKPRLTMAVVETQIEI